MLRRAWTSALMAALFVALDSFGAHAGAPACSGSNLLEALKTSDPDAYRSVMEQAAATENSEAMLWRIEKDGAAPSYLFGTMHVTDPRVTKLSPEASHALTSARTVAIEIAGLTNAKRSEAIARLGKEVRFLDGDHLDNHVTPEDMDQVRAILAKANLPAEMASTLRPWFLTLLMGTPDCERLRAASGYKFLDMQIEDAALDNGKTRVGLETIEEQILSMAAPSLDSQVAALHANLLLSGRDDDMMETMVELYVQRRISAAVPLTEVLLGDKELFAKAFTEFEHEVIDVRNMRMRDRALPLLRKGGAFIAVGALHLSGRAGLVALLREAGYKVTPIN